MTDIELTYGQKATVGYPRDKCGRPGCGKDAKWYVRRGEHQEVFCAMELMHPYYQWAREKVFQDSEKGGQEEGHS